MLIVGIFFNFHVVKFVGVGDFDAEVFASVVAELFAVGTELDGVHFGSGVGYLDYFACVTVDDALFPKEALEILMHLLDGSDVIPSGIVEGFEQHGVDAAKEPSVLLQRPLAAHTLYLHAVVAVQR